VVAVLVSPLPLAGISQHLTVVLAGELAGERGICEHAPWSGWLSVHTEEGQREALRYTSGGRKTGIAGRWPRRPRRTSGPGGLGWTATVRSVHPARRHPRCGQGTGRRARLRCHRDDRDRRPRREALDTVYASAGRKPQLARLLVKTAISGTDQAVLAGQRAYVRAIQPAPDAATKIYAADIAAIAPHALVPGIIQQAARD
jgi:hypothetical protein